MTAMLVTLLAIVWLIVRAVGLQLREAERSREDRALESCECATRAKDFG